MSTAWTLALMLTTFETEAPVVAPVPPVSLRSAYANAIRMSAKKATPDPFSVVPILIDVYERLDADQELPHSVRSKMRRGLKYRLESLRDKVLRNALAQKRQQQRVKLRATRAGRNSQSSELAGGGEIARAVQLIELIQNSIAPDSWRINGGNGTISYFSLLKVLVVRQTGEVNYQIGNGLSKLKK